MNARVLHISFLPVAGMAFFPFVFVKKKVYKDYRKFMNHEKIHLRQQLELLLVGFYLLYLLNYIVNLVRYLNHNRAYMNIVFEKEAYSRESDLYYLERRKFCEWTRFL